MTCLPASCCKRWPPSEGVGKTVKTMWVKHSEHLTSTNFLLSLFQYCSYDNSALEQRLQARLQLTPLSRRN